GKIRQELLQLPPLPRPLQALGGAEHLAVFLEKDRIVIGVFFHGIPLFWFFRTGGGFLQLDKASTFTELLKEKGMRAARCAAPTANTKAAAFFGRLIAAPTA